LDRGTVQACGTVDETIRHYQRSVGHMSV